MKLYSASSLEDIALTFIRRAETYTQSAEKAKTQTTKREAHTRASVWREAAEILRNTELKQ